MASSSNNNGASDSKDNRWYFTAEQLANSPSRRHGIDADQELSFRQLTAYLIQEMGQRLHVSQLCINTAIVYMHRFYAFHSFTHFHRNRIAAASLFLAAKVEEQPRKLEHVIKGSHMCLNPGKPLSPTEYNEQAQDLVFNENVLLQTLGFDVAIDHPHTHVVKTCHLVKACKDLAQTSYFLASNSLHLTSMCLQYRPTVVACFCIYLACKWSRWEIPQSTEGKHWFHYVDKTVTMDLLKQLTDEFIAIYEKSPARLKSKLNSIKALAQGARIPEPSRNISESSNGSQMPQIDPSARPESYSSHHRSHHSSSHPNHHHHSKQPPVPIEPGEHKPSSSHKQPYPPPTVSHSNRPRPERTQAPSETQFNIPAHGSNKTMVPIATSRSSSSSRPQHGIPSSSGSGSSQRTLHTHDPNYHKNRNAIPPLNPPIPSHKMVPKSTDPSRNLLKEPSVRAIDPNKMAVKHPNSLYPSQNPSNNVGLDMTRNVLQSQQGVTPVQQQRSYIAPNTSQAPNYPQQIQSRNSSNIKYDQSVQQQTHLQNSQKQSVESSFNTTNTRQADDVSKAVDQMEICSPPKYSSHPQQTQHTQQSNVQMQTPSSTQTKQLSIFSPEWNEKPSHANISTISSSNNATNKAVGLNIKSNRDSPKKSDREKRSATPKKEKVRSELPVQDYPKIASNDKRALPPAGIVKKPDIPIFSSQNSMPAMSFDIKNQQTHAINFSGVKRPPSTDMTIKNEDDAFRETKIRKVETQSPPRMVDQKSCPPFVYDQQLSNDSKSLKSFPSTVNGIETNPDLVSSLLKESLCNESKFGVTAFIKTEPKDMENFSVVDPGIVMETVPQQILQSDISIKEECTSPSEELTKSKSEKKKKKDKHKHKEKDKSKDKEEKKKHKKDKDKHKEKERLSAGIETSEPVKIKISKDKLNLPILEPASASTSGFKIKIPKDRIKGELSSFQVDDNASTVPIPPPSSLKIKISKDKIENYNHHSQDAALSALYSNSGGNIPSFHGHSSSSSSSKKKDRDREREKEKKRSSNEYNRQNGSGGPPGLPGTSSKNQSNPNKMQQYNCNMSQLFGESNDDEDNLSPPQKNSHPFRYSESNKYSQQQNNSGYYRNSSETVSVSIIQD